MTQTFQRGQRQWKVHRRWDKPIIEQGSDEIRLQLMKDAKKWPFLNGDVFLESNAGGGDFKTTLSYGNHKTGCEPDSYCCQSRVDEEDSVTSNVVLLYGHTKPSSKYKDMRIDSERFKEHFQAWRSLEQLTKYMNAKNLQHGFIITDEEIVVLRLSKRSRDLSEIRQPVSQSSEQQAVQTSRSEPSQLIEEDNAKFLSTLDQIENHTNPSAFPCKECSINKPLKKVIQYLNLRTQ